MTPECVLVTVDVGCEVVWVVLVEAELVVVEPADVEEEDEVVVVVVVALPTMNARLSPTVFAEGSSIFTNPAFNAL